MHPESPEASLLVGMNEIQREGVVHGDGPLLILAGAGSGKTRVLTRRLAHLVAVRRIAPERVLAVTFTNKAAGEMRERVRGLLGRAADTLWLGTFHSICLRILRRHQDRLGFRGPLTVFDTEDQISLLRVVLKESIGSEIKPRKAQSTISTAKNLLLDPDSFEATSLSPIRGQVATVWRLYDQRLRQQDGADFDDLLLLTLKLLEEDAEIAERYADRFQHILVDEYQDTNRAQFQIVRRLAAKHGNVCVVGDDDQSIYRWRGADITNILEFERHFAGARVLRMEQNYRSTGAILDVANAVIRNNTGRKDKTIWTENDRGDSVRLFLGEDEEREARYIALSVRERLRTGDRPEEIAVLSRTHAQSRAIEETLLRSEIAYRVLGGVSFYQRREVKDLLAYLRLLVNPRDEVSFRRAAMAPRRGAGEATCDRLVVTARERSVDLLTACRQAAEWKIPGRGLTRLASMAEMLTSLRERDHEAPHILVEAVARDVDYRGWLQKEHEGEWEERWAHVLELVEGARSYEGSEEETSLVGYLEQVTLYAQTDQLTAGEDRVTLMTVHNAKGLEFTSLFVTGLEEGLFPHLSALADPEELEEERRLFYVAATRARHNLTLTASRRRRRINYQGSSDLSRFLYEIPEDLLSADGMGGLELLSRSRFDGTTARSGIRQREAGWQEPEIVRDPAAPSLDHVRARHVRYGMGEVLRIDGDGERARVEVRFPGWGIKKILRSYLTLEEE